LAKRKKDIPPVPGPQEPGENKDLLECGQKARAGRLLSEYLRAIGQEVDQVTKDDTPRLISKAEALARHIWAKALPHKADNGADCEPELEYIRIVLDRIEGRPGVQGKDDAEDNKESVPDRISRMNVERVNRIAKEVAGETT